MLLESKSAFWSSECTATMQNCIELGSFSHSLESTWLDPVGNSGIQWDSKIGVSRINVSRCMEVASTAWDPKIGVSRINLSRDVESLL